MVLNHEKGLEPGSMYQLTQVHFIRGNLDIAEKYCTVEVNVGIDTFGLQSHMVEDCFYVFSLIYDKKGDSIEADVFVDMTQEHWELCGI